MRRYPLTLVLALLFSLPTLLLAEEWPQFRGINAAGISTESTNLPVEFSVESKVLWSAEIGEGVGSPVISKGRLCVTTMVGKQKFAVLCLDAATGKEFWRREFDTGPLAPITSPNTPASVTGMPMV